MRGGSVILLLVAAAAFVCFWHREAGNVAYWEVTRARPLNASIAKDYIWRKPVQLAGTYG